MSQDSDITLSELRIDGGAAANNLLCQFQADILNIKVMKPKVSATMAASDRTFQELETNGLSESV